MANRIWYEDRIEELIERLEEIVQNNSRPANEIILTDKEVMNILKISKRTLATLKADFEINYSKVRGKCYYKLSDVLDMLENNKA